MNFSKPLFLCIVSFVLFSTLTRAQEVVIEDEDKLSLTEGTISNQFEYIIQRSNSYQDYKVVKKDWLYKLKSHTTDSLKAIQNNLGDTQIVVENQAMEISRLKDDLSQTQSSLDTTNEEKDSMSLFGLQMSKSKYSTLLWSIIAALLALLVIFIYKFKSSNAVTKQAQQTLSETEEEFEEHRRNALEREQKVRRLLQDEINKQKTGY